MRIGNILIKAKEIIKEIENSIFENYEDSGGETRKNLDEFVADVQKLVPNATLKSQIGASIVGGDLCSIYLSLKVLNSELHKENLVYLYNNVKSKLRGLGTNSGITSTIGKTTFESSEKSRYIKISGTKDYSEIIFNCYTSPVTLSFRFLSSLLDPVVASKDFYKMIGKFFNLVLDAVSEMRVSHISSASSNLLEPDKDMVTEIVSKIEKECKFPISVTKRQSSVAGAYSPAFAFFFSMPTMLDPTKFSKKLTLIDAFYQQSKNSFGVPLRSLEELFHTKAQLNTFPSTCRFIMKVKDSSISIWVSIGDFKDPNPNSEIGVSIECMNFNELLFLFGDEDTSSGYSSKLFIGKNTLKLISAISDALVGYKRLITHFVNKPVKKTNADW
jgi:hypothetical protein